MASKKIVLCDTNILIEYFKEMPPIVYELETLGIESIYISSITAAELYYGALNKTELNRIKKKLDSIVHIPVIEPVSNLFEELILKFSLSHKLSIPDALIASTAIYFEIELYTLNLKDFKYIPGLKLYVPKK